jgi:hypothetical protein
MVDAMSILGVSVGVGVVVYALSLRSTEAPVDAEPGPAWSPFVWFRERAVRPTAEDLGFGGEHVAATEPTPEGFVYVPVVAWGGPGWRTRVTGLVGLVALVAVGALVLAFGVYQFGSLLNRMMSGFFAR